MRRSVSPKGGPEFWIAQILAQAENSGRTRETRVILDGIGHNLPQRHQPIATRTLPSQAFVPVIARPSASCPCARTTLLSTHRSTALRRQPRKSDPDDEREHEGCFMSLLGDDQCIAEPMGLVVISTVTATTRDGRARRRPTNQHAGRAAGSTIFVTRELRPSLARDTSAAGLDPHARLPR